jgi:CBS domain-containing protein
MNVTELESKKVCEKPERRVKNTIAEDIIKYGVITVKPDTPIYQAIATLVEKNITGLPVVDKDMSLLGVISEKDLLQLLFESHRGAGVVGEYMTEGVVSFDMKDSLYDICDCLANNVFRRVAILDKGKLTSVISRSDIIRVNKNKFKPVDVPEEPKRETIVAKDIMKPGLITVKRQTTVYQAMGLLADHNITGLPVVDRDMHIEGIVSEKDILKLLYDPDARPGIVEEIMTKEVVCFDKNDTLLDICECLMSNHFRRVMIVDDEELVGIISRADIIVSILKYNASLFRRRQTDPVGS